MKTSEELGDNMLLLSKITLKLRFTTPARLPYWMGSAFRGVFGKEIRRTLCNNLNRSCNDCDSREDCLYYYAYEKKVSKKGHAPPQRPIILIPPFFGKTMWFNNDSYLNVELLFFGDFRKYLPHTLLGLRLAGQEGLASERHYGYNRFEIFEAVCNFSGRKVFDGNTISFSNLKTIEIKDVEPYQGSCIKIGFKTPFISMVFPPNIEQLLNSIRNRLIRFVNEYGTQEKVPGFCVKGRVKNYTKHFHHLERRSLRSEKTTFKGYTGIVEYEFEDIDNVSRWLLSIGLIIGAGSDSSFGLGFLQVL